MASQPPAYELESGTKDLESAPLVPQDPDTDSSASAPPGPDLPPESATPAQVRAFFVEVLCAQYDVDFDAAQDIATHWTVGSGRELRNFPVQIFVDAFGDQAAWVLYKEVGARVAEEKNANIRPDESIVQALSWVFTVFFMLVVAFVFWKGARWILGPLLGILLVMCGVLIHAVALYSRKDREATTATEGAGAAGAAKTRPRRDTRGVPEAALKASYQKAGQASTG